MDEVTRRYWEAIADQVIDRAVEAALGDLVEQPYNSSIQLCRLKGPGATCIAFEHG